jgi:hypothetical protein
LHYSNDAGSTPPAYRSFDRLNARAADVGSSKRKRIAKISPRRAGRV